MCGNSMGGGVAWRYALEHPDRVDRLILVDAVGYESDDSGPGILGLTEVPVVNQLAQLATPRVLVESLLESAYGDPSRVTESLIDRYHDLLRRPGNREAIGRLQAVRIRPDRPRSESSSHETLVMWGELDTWIPPANAERFVSDLPNAELVTYPDLGHVPMEEGPDTSVADVRAFFE
ncbi:MAG: alpha/beta hydrolase [Natrialbaceae archaeon]|nr:alpha/beta hydrolase [Natrialbaceae archaeon]